MGLTSALQIGRSGIMVSQAAIQVAGNNMANAATEGYTRQVASLTPAQGQRYGVNAFVGRGVQLEGIGRQVDEAVRSRLRLAVSEESAASVNLDLLSQTEAILGELSDADLSSQLNSFFNSWSELANTPNDMTARNVVISEGETLGLFLSRLRSDLTQLEEQIEEMLRGEVRHADELLSQAAQLNEDIVKAEQGRGEAGGLRDQRDIVLSELSELMDVTIVEQASGAVDVLVGSLPVVLGNNSRGLELDVRTVDGQTVLSVRDKVGQSTLNIESGSIGARLSQRGELVQPTIDDLDAFTNALIFEVNRIHSQSTGGTGFNDITGATIFTPEEAARALNAADSTLAFPVGNGTFEINLVNLDSGQRQTHQIEVDLDRIDDSGFAGTSDDDSLDDIIDKINAIDGVSAELDSQGRLSISADGERNVVTFSNDSNGFLAAAGINSFFTGANAGDIGIADNVMNDPAMLAVALDHVDGSNSGAVAMANLQTQGLEQLGGVSLRDSWLNTVSDVGIAGSAAGVRLESATLVRESVQGQDLASAGVSLDEESMNLLIFQNQYEASVRFLAVIDELTQALLGIV
ncbi:MAG: flagellar hook-associated protein FlgK [Phycisphaerales bacterium JB038]